MVHKLTLHGGWLLYNQNVITELTVSQSPGIQSQLLGNLHYRIKFRLFSFHFL